MKTRTDEFIGDMMSLLFKTDSYGSESGAGGQIGVEDTPILDPLALDDVTVVYEPLGGRRILAWGQGE